MSIDLHAYNDNNCWRKLNSVLCIVDCVVFCVVFYIYRMNWWILHVQITVCLTCVCKCIVYLYQTFVTEINVYMYSHVFISIKLSWPQNFFVLSYFISTISVVLEQQCTIIIYMFCLLKLLNTSCTYLE